MDDRLDRVEHGVGGEQRRERREQVGVELVEGRRLALAALVLALEVATNL